jgi:hypothetical protein
MKLDKKIKSREDPILRVNVGKKGNLLFPHSPDCPRLFSQSWRVLQPPTSGAYVEGFWLWRMSERLDR